MCVLRGDVAINGPKRPMSMHSTAQRSFTRARRTYSRFYFHPQTKHSAGYLYTQPNIQHTLCYTQLHSSGASSLCRCRSAVDPFGFVCIYFMLCWLWLAGLCFALSDTRRRRRRRRRGDVTSDAMHDCSFCLRAFVCCVSVYCFNMCA